MQGAPTPSRLMTFPSLPAEYPRMKRVSSFDELIATPFEDGLNALCWPRRLAGDFSEVTALAHAHAEAGEDGITALDEAWFARFAGELSPAGAAAVVELRADLARLRDRGLAPELNCVSAYVRDEPSVVVATDVYSFHVDRAPVEVDTWLCTYHGAPTQGLRNEDAQQRIALPGIRERLLAQFGGQEGDAFQAFLREHAYDLHYAAEPGAVPWSFGVGCLWRVAVLWPGSAVPPCIHRAPESDSPRLLLIS
jgi:hypothetical protein